MIEPETRATAAILADAAREAGAEAMRHFRPGARTSADVAYKEGNSPVSEADHAADRALAATLRKAFPGAAWLSEESAEDAAARARPLALVVDPIDGTKAFIAGDPRWCVSVALSLDGRVVAGVLHAPALGRTYVAARGGGSFRDGAPIGVDRGAALSPLLVAGGDRVARQVAPAGV
ncbi:MAG: 3'(2'),5'-bisphosphate nucleotidase CysQ, partial [Hyphomicrobiales bacterium]|nr:3'(2'),5'-bisphosphate nucleotidase CysQ [Hyphomicrobiales bacterium]